MAHIICVRADEDPCPNSGARIRRPIHDDTQRRVSCAPFALYRQIVRIVSQVIVCGAFSIPPTVSRFLRWHLVNLALRTYALYGCSRRVGALVFGAGVPLAAVASVR